MICNLRNMVLIHNLDISLRFLDTEEMLDVVGSNSCQLKKRKNEFLHFKRNSHALNACLTQPDECHILSFVHIPQRTKVFPRRHRKKETGNSRRNKFAKLKKESFFSILY